LGFGVLANPFAGACVLLVALGGFVAAVESTRGAASAAGQKLRAAIMRAPDGNER
jgi:hypothetical protein